MNTDLQHPRFIVEARVPDNADTRRFAEISPEPGVFQFHKVDLFPWAGNFLKLPIEALRKIEHRHDGNTLYDVVNARYETRIIQSPNGLTINAGQ